MSPGNPEFDFVESPVAPGLSVIEAGAGTGKTHAISHLVPRLLLDGTAQRLEEILLVTFTNDAAHELSDRVRGVLGRFAEAPRADEEARDPALARLRKKFPLEEHRKKIARALLEIDRLAVSTIHSFCRRVIEAEGPLCGRPVAPEVIPDAGEMVEEALYDIWKERLASNSLLSDI